MTPAGALVVVLAVVATVGLLMWFVLGRHHPENAAGHTVAPGGWPERSHTLSHQGDVFDRPAGPGAEADGVAGRGQPVPGPSADALPTTPRDVARAQRAAARPRDQRRSDRPEQRGV